MSGDSNERAKDENASLTEEDRKLKLKKLEEDLQKLVDENKQLEVAIQRASGSSKF